jgi:hypothetical protein
MCGDHRTYSLCCDLFGSIFHSRVSKMVGKKELQFNFSLVSLYSMENYKKMKTYLIANTGKDRKPKRL